MLKVMRKKENVKVVMWILAIIIIPAFVLWGAGSMVRERSQGYAGKIFNRKVKLEDYLKSWEAARDQAIMIYGRLFDQIAQYLDLDSQAWDRLILLEEVKRQRIKVKDKELIEHLRDFPLFYKDGRFDPQIYDWVLKYYFRTTPIRFEEQMRESLAISKLVEKIYSQIGLTEAELKGEFVSAHEKARFSYFIVETKDFLNQIEIKEEKELLDYYNQHKESLHRPESVKVEYIAIDASALESGVNVSEEEIKEYFQTHLEEFKPPSPSPSPTEATKEESSAVSPSPKPAEPPPQLSEEIKNIIRTRLLSQRARDKAEEIKNEVVSQLTPQTKLDEIAKKYGISFKETDYFSLDTPLPEIGFNLKFYNYAFKLNVGEVSEPIETKEGYIFLKVKEKRPAYIPEFDAVKDKVEELLKKEKAKKLAKEKAEAVLNQIKDKSWEAFDKESDLNPISTDLITRQAYIPGIGKSEEFIRLGFALNPQEVAPRLIETERGYVVLRLEEKLPIKEEDFEKEKEGFREKTLAKKQQEHFETWFSALKKRANLESNIDNLRSRVAQ